jgi:hypothetical protein
MESDAVAGLVILLGSFSLCAMVLLGCMERQLKRLNKILTDAEEDNKYVN